MSTRLKYSQQTAFGQQVAEYIDELLAIRNKGRRIKAAFDSMAQGGSFTQIEAEVGGMTAGEGQTLYNLVIGAANLLEKPALDELARLDQG